MAVADIRDPQVLAPRIDKRNESGSAVHVKLDLAVVAHHLLLALHARHQVSFRIRARRDAGDGEIVDDGADLRVGHVCEGGEPAGEESEDVVRDTHRRR